MRLAIIPAIVIVALLIAWRTGYFEMDRRQSLLDTVQRLRLQDGIQIWFVLTYAVLITLCVPATIATLLGGAIFGSWKGALLAWIASLLGTVLAHWLSRSVAHKPIRRLFGDHKRAQRASDAEGNMTEKSSTEKFGVRNISVSHFSVGHPQAGERPGHSERRTTRWIEPVPAVHSTVFDIMNRQFPSVCAPPGTGRSPRALGARSEAVAPQQLATAVAHFTPEVSGKNI